MLELQDLARKITPPLAPNFIADQLVAGSHDYIQRALAGRRFNDAEEFLTAARQIEMVEKRIGARREEQAKVQTAMLMNEAQEIERRRFSEMMESLRNTVNELAAQVREVRNEINFPLERQARDLEKERKERHFPAPQNLPPLRQRFQSPPPTRQRPQNPPMCYFCGKSGHISRECRKRIANERTRPPPRGSDRGSRPPFLSKK